MTSLCPAARCDSLEREREQQLEMLQQQRQLVQKLEDDLGSMNSVAALCRGEGEVSQSDRRQAGLGIDVYILSMTDQEDHNQLDVSHASVKLTPLCHGDRGN